MKSDSGVVILGAGHAGLMSAVCLRQKKYKGPILIVGKEKYLPYQRPPLSKSFIANEVSTENLYLKTENYFRKNNIDILIDRKAEYIDKNKKIIQLDNKKQLSYEKLIIATGSKLKKLNLNCTDENLFYLRDIDNAIRLRSALNQKKTMLIIGAGYIGLEVASIARKRNLKVTIVDISNRVMGRSVSKYTSDFLYKKHQAHGVKFEFDQTIKDIDDFNNKKRVIFDNGKTIDADLILLGIGVTANTELAEKSGLECKNGIIVDENCRTSESDIFAAGDCANQYRKLYNYRQRLESVHNATSQSKIISDVIIGKNIKDEEIPWFWSDQYNLKLLIAGLSMDHENYVVRGNASEEKFTVFYLKNERVIALEAINDQKSFSAGKKLIKTGIQVSRAFLKDKDSDIKNYFL